jgi:predicted alpha/beta superfamily hydrolase
MRCLHAHEGIVRASSLWILILFASVCAFEDAVAQDEPVNIGLSRTLRSEVLKEERKINVYLPQTYESSQRYRRYPVLYVRDGGKFFHSFTGVVDQLTSDATPRAPEMIVIAILETNRVRDSAMTRSSKGFTGKNEPGYESSGGGGDFLRFLEQELIPYVDKSFSTSSYRIYCGYSFTGLSVLAALLDEKSPFDAYIAIDPSWWWDDYATERRALATLTTRTLQKVQLFMAASGESYPTNYFISSRDIESLARIFDEKRPAGIEWGFKRYGDESHHSIPQLALYDGLSYIFRDHKPSLDELYNRPEKLRERYEKLSGRLGEKMALREDLLDFFGYQFLNDFKDPQKATRYFELNAQSYPGSPNVWASLGDAYTVMGDKAAAIRMFEKVLSLDPANDNARKKLNDARRK